jgi:Ca2+-binding RTX toxin-like protein
MRAKRMYRVGHGAMAVAFLLALSLLLAGAISLGALAASPCAGRPTVSADGTKVYGSSCSDRIVVLSPHIRKVFGGKGNDVIYANPNVKLVDGGPGNDVIYGELPETETGRGASPQQLLGSGPIYMMGAHRARRLNHRRGVATMSMEKIYCEQKTNEGKSCYGGLGNQELIGGSGNDKIFGQRGNDKIYGNSGDDSLYGGIGDESIISGGAGNDLLSGGLGADHLNGNQGSDLLRGDGTIDTIEDTGPEGTDTLSFATAVTPGFSGEVGIAGFPADSESAERGVYVRLDGNNCSGSYQACDNNARYGGGDDTIVVSGIENVIGSPFADQIVGSESANRIDGGGGADVIYGKGGEDTIYGGADGDYIDGGAGADAIYGQGGTNHCASDASDAQSNCAGSAEEVVGRNTSKISVGFMVAPLPENLAWQELYVTGSSLEDKVEAAFSIDKSGTGHVVFTTESGSAPFDTSSDAKTAGCEYEEAEVQCTLAKPTDAIVMAGMAGKDKLSLNITESFWEITSPILLGGEGDDELFGSGHTEDMLVDGNGNGNDKLYAYAYDDALINNEGADTLEGGNGNDLLLSASVCDGDTLQGAESGQGDGSAQNSASWAKLPDGLRVVADLERDYENEKNYVGSAGDSWDSTHKRPACSGSETHDTLRNIDDLEGSSGNDILLGDPYSNNLLGRLGEDGLWGREGADNIEAEDGAVDEVGGGPGTDTCSYDSFDKVSGCP